MANTKTAAFENAAGSLLNRKVIEATSLLTTTSLTDDVEVPHTDWLTVQGDLVGDGDADLSVAVTPYEEDNVTRTAFTLVPDSSAGPTHTAGAVRFIGRYNVQGIDRVRITWTNNDGATRVLTRASWNTRRF